MKLWGKCDHPNIVKVFTLFDDADENEMYLNMQLADLGQLADYF
jgi:serine/threonine protein kinase